MSLPLIDIRAWRQFIMVADELHFGRAAQRLNMTQPPLTQAIAGLERQLGVRLFDRTKRSVQLTPAGAALLPQAQDLVARALALPEQARAAASGEVGRLRLAFVSTVGFGGLPGWVRNFRATSPGVRLELTEATGDVQLRLLREGRIDAGIVLHAHEEPAPLGITRQMIGQEPLWLALPQAHPLAKTANLAFEQVAREPLVLFPRAILPAIYDGLLACYAAVGRALNVEQEAIQMQTIVNLVSAELGLAWVPQSVSQLQRAGVVYRGLQEAPFLPVCETSVMWMSSQETPVLSRWLQVVRETSS
ncbi:LysR family transcriptional regulator [Ottowia thiooxydans]|uniref:LysR family transcriptional regulator n=1 Tax=Ottowia thiooxydans TaxID=219182 RepID=UPI00048FD38D|nr:LysR family transcriptional regulator [Ottowia thiooxydans]